MEFGSERVHRIAGYENEQTGHIFCAACSSEIFIRRSLQIESIATLQCAGCGRDASFPFHREAKLYELDGSWCQTITGKTYDELREAATNFFGGTDWNMNSPTWDVILNLSARDVWEWRRQQWLKENGHSTRMQEIGV